MNTLRKSIEKEKTTPFYTKWSQLEQEISILHKEKEQNAGILMEQGIAIYKALLEQCSSEEEKLEPLNNQERLAFIGANSASYAAFRQLQELFKEMEKKIASRRATLKAIN